MKLFHSSHKETLDATLAGDLCCADHVECTTMYGANAYSVVIPDDCTTESCEGYDIETDEAPADDEDFRDAAEARGVDVLIYDDVNARGRSHKCYRLVSDRVLAAAVITRI